ncbi:MAG: serine hydrolase domain-containing protein [Ramlibacter sp.]
MAALNTAALQRLRSVLRSHVDRGRIPGAVAVVALGGHVECFETVGCLDAQAGTPMPADAIFRIYSMTKPMVSLAALMLAEEGRLQLTDPVAAFLPEFGAQQVAVEEGAAVRLVPASRPATVHDLLRHTAGLTYEFLGDSAVQRQYRDARLADRSRSNAQFSSVLAAMPLAHHPGACWEYSHATDVLGAVLEVVTGQSLAKLLRERLLEPLGMKDTAFAVPEAQWHRIAQPLERDPDTGEAVELLDARAVPAFESGGGGLVSTADDYLRFLRLLRNQGRFEGARLVSRKTVEWMTVDHLGSLPARHDLLPPGHGFGLGVAVRTAAGLAAQPGSVGQYFWSGIGGTYFFVDPAEDLFALLLLQAPNQRIQYRNLFRHLVYAAVD